MNLNELYDMAGNVREWNDAIMNTDDRIVRGGAFDLGGSRLASTGRGNIYASYEDANFGFRVVASSLAPVPEPVTYAGATGLATLVVGIWLRHIRPRRARRG
jgi:hypothetical protein